MAGTWFLRQQGNPQVYGPIEAETLRRYADEGRVRPGDMVAQSAEGPWYPAEKVRGLFDEAKSTSTSAGTAAQPPVAKPLEAPPAATRSVASPRTKAPSASKEKPLTADDFARRRRLRRRKQKTLVVSGLVGLVIGAVILIVVLIRPPVQSSSTSSPTAQASAEPNVPDLPIDSDGKPILDELGSELGVSTTAVSTSPAAPGGDELDSARQAAAAFGGEFSKLSDETAAARVQIVSAEIGRVRVEAGATTGHTANPYLILRMELTNRSGDKPLSYRSWSLSGNEITVTQRGEQPLKQKALRGMKVVGQQAQGTIPPGDTIDEVLVFELPEGVTDPAGLKDLELKLPASAFGEEGEFSLYVPVSQVKLAPDMEPDRPGLMRRPQADEAAVAEKPNTEPTAKPKDEPEEEYDEAIPIPGLEDDQSADPGPGFSDDPELMKRFETIQQEEDRRTGRAPRSTPRRRP
ncbi:hypothetical protein JCM19992_31220 [Thermostilla marina]